MANCTALEEVQLTGSITNIRDSAFRNCTSLKSLTLPEGIQTLGLTILYGSGVQELTIPKSVMTIYPNSKDANLAHHTFDQVAQEFVLKVYKDSSAAIWAQGTTTDKTSQESAANYEGVVRWLDASGESDVYMSYDEDAASAYIWMPEAMQATVIFANYIDEQLQSVAVKAETQLNKGGNTVEAGEMLSQPNGSVTKVMLWQSMESVKPLCTPVVQEIKVSLQLAGDSIMCQWPDSRYPQQGWGEPFRGLFHQNIRVINNAVSGYTAEAFYNNKWPSVKANLKEGDYFMVSFLHNDYCKTLYTDGTGDPNYISVYREYLQKYIDECKAMDVNIILVVPPNRGVSENFHGEAFSSVMPELAQSNSIPCIDVHAKTIEMLTADLEGVKKQLYLYKLVEQDVISQEQLNNHSNSTLKNNGEDLTHLSISGADWVAGYVAEQLKTQAPDLAVYLKQ